MNGVLFRKTIIPISQAADGESPTMITVTKESNGHAVWFQGFKAGQRLLQYFTHEGGYHAIEWAITQAPKTDVYGQLLCEEMLAVEEIKNSRLIR